MQTTETHRRLMAQIKEDIKLPSPPAIAVKILDAVNRDDAELTSLGDIISSDPALTAKMLKVANSETFTQNGNISNINRAMTVLGTNLIKNIALSFIIADNLSDDNTIGFDCELFWRRSVTTAVAAEKISKSLQFKNEDIFVASLLQDIGILLMASNRGNEYIKLIHESRTTGPQLEELEKEKYGFDHMQVAYALLVSWNFPESITTAILYHHQPQLCPEDDREATEILFYADRLADIFFAGEVAEKARNLQQDLIDRYSLSSDQARDLLDETAEASREILDSFELDPGEIRPYSALLQEANESLSKLHLSAEQVLLEMHEAKQRSDQLTEELKSANTRLKELVYRDGLTGLYNHRYFQESLSNELSRAIRYQSSFSLILFDVDHFKKVNDTYGHPAGDQVLMNISKAVSSAVRPSDIVARHGGEEFAVILPETSAAGAKVFAARLRRCVEGIATQVDGQLIYVTISAGTTTFTVETHDTDKNTLIEIADQALYQAKQSGRNQVVALTP